MGTVKKKNLSKYDLAVRDNIKFFEDRYKNISIIGSSERRGWPGTWYAIWNKSSDRYYEFGLDHTAEGEPYILGKTKGNLTSLINYFDDHLDRKNIA